MSILSSTNTGINRLLKEYFDNLLKCKTAYSYEIKKSSEDNIYDVYISCKHVSFGIFIDAEYLPNCRLFFDKNCTVYFTNFKTLDDFKKINFNCKFPETLYDFKFFKCIFNEELSKYVISSRIGAYIKKSVIYFSEEKLQNIYLNHYRDINIQSALNFLKKENEVIVIEKNIDKS